MSRALVLVSWVAVSCYQPSGTALCPGPSVPFLGSCYQFVQRREDFWGAGDSCMGCGGHLASMSHELVLTFLKRHLNESSSWWIGGAVSLGPGSHLTLSCVALTFSAHSFEMQETPCVQKYPFICKSEGQSCGSHLGTRSLPTSSPAGQGTQTHPFGVRRRRSAVPYDDFPDLLHLADQLRTSPNVGGHNLTDLLLRVSSMMQDEEETDITHRNEEVSLLVQLSDRIQCPDIRASRHFANLSSVVYFGVNSVLQFALSSCSKIKWTSQERQSLSNSSLDILHSLQISTLSNLSVIGAGVLVQTPMFSLQMSSVNSSDLGRRVLSFPSRTPYPLAQVIFPMQPALHSAVQMLPAVQIQMMSFAQNPFTSNSGQNVSGTVASLSLMSGVRELHIQNISDNFQIFLPRSAAEYKTPTQFQISGDKSLRLSLMVTPLGSTLIIIVTVTQGVPLQLYHGRQSVAEAQGTSGSNTDSHTWVLPPELFSDPLSPQTFLVSPTNSSGTQSLHLGVSSFTARCAFWDTATQQWGSDGCKVGPQTSVAQVQCLCSHLSFFGSSFLVLPVQVDVTRTAEYFSQISENPIIVVLLACFYACYILTVTWARRMDLSDRAKSRVIMVRDNDPCALYRYRVIVCTGHRRGAATSAKVSLSLYGSYGQCGPVLLSDTRRGAFRSGSVDIFLLTTPFPLGELQSVTLSHDGTGPRSSWYVVQVTAQDMQLKKSWHFVCNSWLSLPPRGESLTRTFPAANKQELTSFRNIFLKKTIRGLRDEHIWISVLNHPVRSVFTRVQRVSCCMCLLLCTIVINLMFWELPQGSYPVLISMGSFSLTWKDIMIGFESALLMFPVNLLIIFIFRNTRPRGSGAARTRTGLCCCRRGGKREPPTACRRSPPSRPLGLTSVLEDLEGTVQTLSRASQNTVPELEMKPEYPCDIGSLLQLISHTLQKQLTPGSLQVSVTLAQLPAEDLHALFCSHYVCRKLRKVSRELQQLGPHEFPDKTRYDESLAQLQTLLHVLEKAVPPLPPQSSPQKQHAQQKRLPWWFLLIGWFLLVSISTVSTYFTMLYGFQYGRQSSIRWVISMALSLFQSIFILQPLKVIGFAVFFALVLKKVEEEEEEEEELDVELVPDVVTPGDQLCNETIL